MGQIEVEAKFVVSPQAQEYVEVTEFYIFRRATPATGRLLTFFLNQAHGTLVNEKEFEASCCCCVLQARAA